MDKLYQSDGAKSANNSSAEIDDGDSILNIEEAALLSDSTDNEDGEGKNKWFERSDEEFANLNPNWLPKFAEKCGYHGRLKRPNGEYETFFPKTALDGFKVFFDDEVIHSIHYHTNLYQQQVLIEQHEDLDLNGFVELTKEDIWSFLGCLMYMGIVKLPQYKFHWRQDTLFGKSIISEIMTKDKFEYIKKYFHLNDNLLANPVDKLYKLRPYLTRESNIWKSVYYPHRELCIDESMFGFRGRVKFKQYCPDKPTKFGFKVFTLCDAISGFIYAFDVYTGKKDVPTRHLGGRTVIELIKGLENKGHVIYMDNFYTSVPLLRELERLVVGATGTVRRNRKGLPLGNKKLQLKQDQALYFQQGNLITVIWKDRREVFLMTTCDYGKTTSTVRRYTRKAKVPRQIPYPILQYNKYKGAVDLCNQYCSYYGYDHRIYKWWFRIFTGIMEMALYNSYIVMKEVQPTLFKGFIDFRLALCKEIFAGINLERGIPKKPLFSRIAVNHHCERGKQRSCKVCSTAFRKRTTRNICLECQVNICKGECWMIYHTKALITKRNKDKNFDDEGGIPEPMELGTELS